jgi:hypothetical protein
VQQGCSTRIPPWFLAPRSKRSAADNASVSSFVPCVSFLFVSARMSLCILPTSPSLPLHFLPFRCLVVPHTHRLFTSLRFFLFPRGIPSFPCPPISDRLLSIFLRLRNPRGVGRWFRLGPALFWCVLLLFLKPLHFYFVPTHPILHYSSPYCLSPLLIYPIADSLLQPAL